MSIRSIFGFGGRRTLQSVFYASLCATFLASGTLIGAVNAAPGELDTTFGGGTGRVESDISATASDRASGVLVQSDGKIVVAGTCPSGAFTAFCVVRYETDGTIDTSYGDSGGLTISAIGARNAKANFALLQPDGKVVVIGSCEVGSAANLDFCIARYTTSGILDATFSGGSVITNTGSAIDEASYAVLQPDGKIVVAGSCRGTKVNFCLLRYNANGGPDSSFGTNGRVTTALSVSADDTGKVVALQPDGKIVVMGGCPFAVCLARYLPSNGALDTSFSGDGKLIDSGVFVGNASRGGLAIQNDDKIVVLQSWGQSGNGGGAEGSFLLKRYLSNGDTDIAFGIGGESRFSHTRGFNGTAPDDAHMLSIQPLDGKFLVAGTCEVLSTRRACVARANNDGFPDLGFGITDPDFGRGGKSYDLSQNRPRAAFALAMQADGKIVTAGTCDTQFVTASENFCVERRLGGPLPYRQCSLDIDGDGIVSATTDTLIATRVALGMTGPTVLAGINLAGKPRSNWNDIRKFLVTQCGMSIAQ
jgi:uncharacterized delta-60 repeat protein